MGSSLPRETQDAIIGLYRAGWSMRRIGVHVHWSEHAVQRVLKVNGVARRGRGGAHNVLTPDEFDRVVEPYQRGESMGMVAQRLGISETTVKYRLLRAGVEIRGLREANRVRHRRNIARRGAEALAPIQRRALQLLQENGGELLTLEVARALACPRQPTYDALRRLSTLGLVASSRRGPRLHAWKRTPLGIADVLDAKLDQAPARGTGDLLLPAAPFREWLLRLISQERRSALVIARDGADTSHDGQVPAGERIALRLGVPQRRLWGLLNGQENVSLTLADRAITNAGTATRLEDLWPELSDHEAAA